MIFISVIAACGGGSEGDNEIGFTSDLDYINENSKRAGLNEVIIHELGDPDKINPILSSSANSTYIESNIFQALLSRNPETLELEGMVAKGRPIITPLDSGEYAGGLSLEYEIRPEATWDNGDPITAEDYIFALKIVKNPKVSGAANIRPYLEFIDHVEVDPSNPKKFTVYSKNAYFMAESFSGYYVYPRYHYDPDGLMENFTLKELNNPANRDRLIEDPNINKFAEQFESEQYQREAGYVVGSGPYEFVEWKTGQYITLKRKSNWWGDKVDATGLTANPDVIEYKIISDQTAAVTDLKDEGLDVQRSIQPKQFEDLRTNERFKKLYNLHDPLAYSYTYLGMNMKNPKLSDVKVRKAVAHLVNVQEIIDILYYGHAQPIVGPIHPTKSYYNDQLTLVEYDPDKAAALLDEAGWKDNDGDGIREKTINGVKTPLTLEFKYNSGNDIRKEIGLFLQENAKQVGMDINIVAKEWTVFLDDTKRRDFEITCLGWIQGPDLDDLKQIWHTESDTYDGSNRIGFGSAESDAIIEAIQYELDEEKRKELYFEIQKIIYEEQPYVFLYSPKNLLAIHGRFDNANPTVLRPGYAEPLFKLATSSEAEASAE